MPPTLARWPRPGPKQRPPTSALRFGVETCTSADVDGWRTDSERTTYLLDVRTPEEFEAGHLAGSRNAPGGQLVQATDEYVATRGSRLVLIDDNGVRATMTASWLRQLGWADARVLAGGLPGLADAGVTLQTGTERPSVGRTDFDHQRVSARRLAHR